MAELKFKKNGEVTKRGEYVCTLVIDGNSRRFPQPYVFENSGSMEVLTADELEQIAPKLRELNGEPPARALDERVKELRAWCNTESHNWINVDVLNTYERVLQKINELFPAELKEKQDNHPNTCECPTCTPDHPGYPTDEGGAK